MDENSRRGVACRCTDLFLHTALETRIARVGARARDASDADAAVARAQENYDLGDLGWAKIDAAGTPEETLQQARRLLRRQFPQDQTRTRSPSGV